MSRVLKPHGTLIVGFDNSLSLDFIWVLLDALGNRILSYDASIGETVRRLSSSAKSIPYPHITSEGGLHFIPERFVRFCDVASCIKIKGLSVRRYYGIHFLSALIPFTSIADPHAKPWIKKVAQVLCGLDPVFRRLGGSNMFAYHILVFAVKS
jgi:hypothetical protein